MMIRATLLLVVCLCGGATAFTTQELRNFFEWGEYGQLIDSLEPHIVAAPCGADSLECAQLHHYLGVAYFGKGRIGEAQVQFRQALSYRPDFLPDSTYLSAELNGLIAVTRVEFFEKLSKSRSRDSLLLAEKEAFNANMRAIRSEEARKSRRSRVLLAVSFYTLSTALGAAAAFEYRAARPPYAEFTAAADGGDRVAYERLRPEIRRANAVIAGCAAGAGATMAAGVTFTVRSLRRGRE